MILVFDTETTGLTLHPDAPLEKQPRIIELGAALLDETGQVVETYTQLINPEQELTDEITQITGITNSDLVDAPTFKEALPVMWPVFEQAFAVFAHNLPFDKTMLKNELTRISCFNFPWPAVEYCTVGIHKDLWGRNPKLVELYEFATGHKLPQTHRALDDVIALVEVITALDLHSLAYVDWRANEPQLPRS